jgi:nitric oxide reductase subunit B
VVALSTNGWWWKSSTERITSRRFRQLSRNHNIGIDMDGVEQLSAWWGRAVALTFVLGFGVLILLTSKAYQNAPPIPDRVVDATGAVVFTGDDVRSGQEVFLKYGLMDNGTIWGHGGYLGPDFSATVLHNWALDLAGRRAQARFGRQYDVLSDLERAAIDGEVASLLKTNRYDSATGTLTLLPEGAETFADEAARWNTYFQRPELNGGL